MCKGQLKVLHNLLPASSGVERGGGGRGASAPGPGPVVGARASCGGPGQAGFSSSFF